MKTLEIDRLSLMVSDRPMLNLVKSLIKAGAPLKIKSGDSGLLMDITSSDVEFTGTIFRRVLDNQNCLYGWNE